MERAQFIRILEAEFPDAFARIDKHESGLLHREVGVFRTFVEQKMDEGATWYCEKAFRFVAHCIEQAEPALQNAIDVSFIYGLAVGKQNEQRYRIVKERAPHALLERMVQVDVFWK